MVRGGRQCCRTSAWSRSRSRGIEMGCSSWSSSRSGNAGWGYRSDCSLPFSLGFDNRWDRGAFRRGLRGEGFEGHHLSYDREGVRGAGGVVFATVGGDLPGDLRRCDRAAIIQLWKNNWAEFMPFPEYDVKIHRMICTTNTIKSINARYHRTVRAREYLPNEQATLKCLYLLTRSPDPPAAGRHAG